MEILGGRGVLKAKFLEEKYENKLEYPGGRGTKQKPSVERVWIFSVTTQCFIHMFELELIQSDTWKSSKKIA